MKWIIIIEYVVSNKEIITVDFIPTSEHFHIEMNFMRNAQNEESYKPAQLWNPSEMLNIL